MEETAGSVYRFPTVFPNVKILFNLVMKAKNYQKNAFLVPKSNACLAPLSFPMCSDWQLTWVEGAAGPLGLVPLLLPPRAPASRPRQPLLDGRVPGVRPGLLHTRPRVPLVPWCSTEHAALLPPTPLLAAVVVVVDVVEVDAESAGRCCTVVRLISGSGPSRRVSREHQHYFSLWGLTIFTRR